MNMLPWARWPYQKASLNQHAIGFVLSITITIISASITLPSFAVTYDHMDDANKTAGAPADPQVPAIDSHLFPRVYLLGIKTPVPAPQYAKYHQISGQGWEMGRVGSIQQNYPDVQYLRQISPRAYQSYDSDYCKIGANMAFEGTGDITQGGPQSAGCKMYAGHWLYRAGTTLTQSIGTSTLNLKVADVSKIDVGQYVVIYNAPAGSFNNAEHAKVTGKNVSTKTITLQSRSYKSNPRSHPVGAIVAQHIRGQGTDPRLWAYNLSTQCPTDGAGRTFAQAMSTWLQTNIGKTQNGGTSNAVVSGIVFDADPHFEIKNTDANNDLVTDNGMSPSGVNWWGNGLDQFYTMVRNKLPHMFILGGTPNSRGFSSLNGTQMESWPVDSGTNFNPNPKYDDIDHFFSTYRFHSSQHEMGPPVVHTLTKNPTLTYPESGSGVPSSNKSFRLALGLTLLDNGYFGRKTTDDVFDPWYDEFAVDVETDSPNYGTAIQSTDVTGARTHRGWLGSPISAYERIYGTEFAPNQSMLSDGSFDNNISGWSGTSVNVSRVTGADVFEGSGALRSSNHTSYKSKIGGATIKGPRIPITKDNWYTIAFSAKADSIRQIKAALGSSGHKLLIGEDWQRYVISFKAKSTGTQAITFSVGQENTKVWLDSVYVFEGNANVFRRDFDNGIVVVNATPNTRTIDLNGIFQRINGTQSAVNDGSTLSQVTLPSYDSTVLVRPNDSGGGGGSQPTINISSESVAEDNGSVRLAFTLSESSSNEVRINFTTLDNSATAGQDYTAKSGVVVFSPGQTNKTRSFSIFDDTETETAETFFVELSNPLNGNIGAGTGTITIQDDDNGGGSQPTIYVSSDTTSEGGGTVSVAFTLSEPSSDEVTVNFNTIDGTASAGQDYTSNSGVVIFNPGQISVSRSFSILDDAQSEVLETFLIELSNPLNATLGTSTGTVTILDDDSGGGNPSVDPCWKPHNFDTAVNAGLFIWKSCANNRWHFRMSAGGAATKARFAGMVTADVAMTAISAHNMESGKDSVTRAPDRKQFEFVSEVINNGEDGVIFGIPANAQSACLTISEGGPIYLGNSGTLVSAPLNLLDSGSACQ